MVKFLELHKNNCKNCYKCIRNCSVKSISFNKNHVSIIQDECILCGQCYVVCPQGAKEVWSNVNQIKSLIASGRQVIASIAPSFIADFPTNSIEGMEIALKKIGFSSAYQTAEGATLVKNEYENLMKNNKQEVIISSCCPSVNFLIQKYYPDCLKYLANVSTPMVAHCRGIKKEFPDAATVFIGPCIAKFDEASKEDSVDAVLSLEQLASWFEDENIKVTSPTNLKISGRSAFFPTNGGIIKSFAENHPEYDYIIVDGVQRCIETLIDLSEGVMNKCFIEMSSCVGSCVGGPLMNKGRKKVLHSHTAVKRYAGEAELPCIGEHDKAIETSFNYLRIKGMMRPGEDQISTILRSMGKQNPALQLNCGSCGYDTCRDKAIAVYNNKAEINMCLPYLMEKAKSFSDIIINNSPNGILVINEDLIVQQINKSALSILNLAREEDVIGEAVVRILDPVEFVIALENKENLPEKRMYLVEYKKYIDYSIVFNESYNILILVMKDVTQQELANGHRANVRENAIQTTNKVIDNQMKIVQEIAFLLGETAAETKIALTKLKDSLNDE